MLFQSTQPSQAVTRQNNAPQHTIGISIHTALAGCDRNTIYFAAVGTHFNPHSPRRLWLQPARVSSLLMIFQSTQPSQAVTLLVSLSPGVWKFQSTQPSQAVTNVAGVYTFTDKFQSTQPSQAVTTTWLCYVDKNLFQSTQPSQAVTACCRHTSSIPFSISIHTALAGCDSNNTQQKPHSNRHNHIQCIYI